MTDIATLGNLLRLARDTVSNPREGAATVLSFAPAPQALWLMFALVIVTSLFMGEFVLLLTGAAAQSQVPQSPVAMAIAQVVFLVVMIQAIHRIGRFFGGTGSFQEAMLLVIWLQFILICVQVIQILAILIVPPLAGIITLLAIVLVFWLLVNFVAVLHGFTSLAMVFVATLVSAFGLAFVLTIVMSWLGLTIPVV
ncbi:YIP1 family protein [Roseibacterium sp. SDUM158016]|jgi:hypothetical protein|uniref:Yip1 family protein n=1 Tax=Roseicyclus sediminis TaxID=2980997 RepID=UPI0021D06886|nr:Yip1 family protein [Roseibacterium sp. SDUM158016]MCU4651973.1 YIP1 family protein [Roseibacterium sp. SDUM158016]